MKTLDVAGALEFLRCCLDESDGTIVAGGHKVKDLFENTSWQANTSDGPDIAS